MEHLNLKTFKEKICNCGIDSKESETKWIFKGDKPAVIDFYASWCGPCKVLSPILEDLAREYAGKIDIYKIDTEKESELASMFGIRSIPSILFIPVSGEPQMAAGALPKEALRKAFNDILGVK